MSNLNKVMLIGRLGRDPEVRFLENGTAVAKLGLATTESYKDKNSGEWVDLTAVSYTHLTLPTILLV